MNGRQLPTSHDEPLPTVLLNKPFRVLCQFTDDDGRPTLADYVPQANVYPAGRLDYDSEGLIVLTDDGRLQARLSQPRSNTSKTYWAQVEGDPTEAELARLEIGVKLKDGPARALRAERIDEPPGLWPRNPPIRYRKNVPDTWLEIQLTEGRNRQVRRMTAGIGYPTLRLIRSAVGPFSVAGLAPGECRDLANADAWAALTRRP